MATFVQMSEHDHALDLAALLNDLALGEKQRTDKADKMKADEEFAAAEAEKNKASALGKMVEAGDNAGVLNKFFESTEKLLKYGSEEVVECAFTLAFALYSRIKEADRAATCSKFLGVLSKDTTKPSLSLSLLGVLFSMVEPAQRFAVFMGIVAYAEKSKSLAILDGQLNGVAAWAKEWELPAPQAAQLFAKAASLVDSDKSLSQTYRLEYLAVAGKPTAETKAIAAAVASACIQNFHEKPEEYTCFDCNAALDMALVKDLEKDSKYGALYELLSIFATKNVSDYFAFAKKNAKSIQQLGLEEERTASNLRTATLCSMGLAKSALSYDELKKELQLESGDDVEAAVIDAVMSGRFEGKIDQEKCEVLVEKTTSRGFSEKDWGKLSDKLGVWKSNIRKVLDNLQNIQIEHEEEA